MLNLYYDLLKYYEKYKPQKECDFYKNLDSIVNNAIDDISKDFLNDISNMLKQKDIEYLKNKPKNIKINGSKKPRTIHLLHGKLTYYRNIYTNLETGKDFYYIDQLYGIPKHARFHPSVNIEILKLLKDMSFERATKLLKNISMCPKTAWNILNRAKFEKIKFKSEKRLDVKTIFIEADEDHEHHWKNKKHAFWEALVYVHEGRTTVNGRTQLVNAKYFGGKNQTTSLWSDVATYVKNTYSSDVEVIILGDGANWIKGGMTFFPDCKFILDKFHAVKAIAKICGDDINLKNILITAIKEKNKFKMQTVFDIVNHRFGGRPEYILNQENYLINNLEFIDLTKKYRCSAEAHISHVYADRMSSRPICWSKKGARKMAKLRCLAASGIDLNDYVHVIF